MSLFKDKLSDLEYLGFYFGISFGFIIASVIWFIVYLLLIVGGVK